jgi:ABC-type cobalamin transport system permease subunit
MFARIYFRKEVSGRCLFYWLYGVYLGFDFNDLIIQVGLRPTILREVQLRIFVGGGIDDVCCVIYGMDIARNRQREI